jgi:tRNA (cytidine32/guanosine34-2'-O)-methyltransferase
VLKTGGTFVAKVFKGRDTTLMYAQFKSFFKFVQIVKPSSSRSGSIEAFLVCQEYQQPAEYVPILINPISNRPYSDDTVLAPVNEALMPFTTAGDLSGFDALLSSNLELEDDPEFDAVLNGFDPTQASSSGSS